MAKIFYVYDKPFWDPNVTVIVTLPTLDSDDNRPPPSLHEHFHTFVPLAWNSSVLMNWQSGEGPPVIDQLDDEVTVLLIAVQQHLPMQELSTTVTDVLRHTFNNTSIPKPVRIIRQRWTQNALFGGSYSYISVAAAKANVYYDRMANPVRIDGQLRLLFAGEATHNRIYQTTIGAWLSVCNIIDLCYCLCCIRDDAKPTAYSPKTTNIDRHRLLHLLQHNKYSVITTNGDKTRSVQ